MIGDDHLSGSRSYRRHAAELAHRAKEQTSRPNKEPRGTLGQPTVREVTLADDETIETETVAVFDPFTERWVEQEVYGR